MDLFKAKPSDPQSVLKAFQETGLELVIHPALVLKRKCKPIYLGLCPKQEPGFVAAAELGKQMLKWMEAYNSVKGKRFEAVGLASTQIGQSLRLFAMMPKGKVAGGTAICINPEIINTGRELVEEKESCLSVPGKKRMKSRHAIIVVRYWDENGAMIEKTLRRWEARIFQHELDHINGKLCTQ